MGVRERQRAKKQKKLKQEKLTKKQAQIEARGSPASRKKGGANSPAGKKPKRLPDKTLVVGEGDFSFSVACIKLEGGKPSCYSSLSFVVIWACQHCCTSHFATD